MKSPTEASHNSSSLSSRESASSGVSSASILPPGNSHLPGSAFPGPRCTANTLPFLTMTAPTTSIRLLMDALPLSTEHRAHGGLSPHDVVRQKSSPRHDRGADELLSRGGPGSKSRLRVVRTTCSGTAALPTP